MEDKHAFFGRFTGRNEYKYIPLLNISYSICIIVLMMFIPAEDNLKMQLLLLMVIVYTGVLTGTSVRALRRIEERLDKLG